MRARFRHESHCKQLWATAKVGNGHPTSQVQHGGSQNMLSRDDGLALDLLRRETLTYPLFFASAREWVRRILTFLVPFLIAGLDISFAQKALYIALWIWGALAFFSLFHVGAQAIDALLTIVLNSRLTYIAVHLQNEKQALPLAWDRLQDDLRSASGKDSVLGRAAWKEARQWMMGLHLVVATFYVVAAVALAFTLAKPASVAEWVAWIERFLTTIFAS
jgi:hypothetical protein